jgi:hypothetical protein
MIAVSAQRILTAAEIANFALSDSAALRQNVLVLVLLATALITLQQFLENGEIVLVPVEESGLEVDVKLVLGILILLRIVMLVVPFSSHNSSKMERCRNVFLHAQIHETAVETLMLSQSILPKLLAIVSVNKEHFGQDLLVLCVILVEMSATIVFHSQAQQQLRQTLLLHHHH